MAKFRANMAEKIPSKMINTTQKWEILIKKESEALINTGEKIPRVYCNEMEEG